MPVATSKRAFVLLAPAGIISAVDHALLKNPAVPIAQIVTKQREHALPAILVTT